MYKENIVQYDEKAQISIETIISYDIETGEPINTKIIKKSM